MAKNAIVLSVLKRGDCQLEIWGLEAEKQAFEKVFGKKLMLEIVEADRQG